MPMHKLVAAIFAVVALTLLGACALTASQASDISTFLAQLNNTAAGDFANAEAAAQAMVPPDSAGYQCAVALDTQRQVVGKVLATAGQAGAGAITAAELASVLVPGSPQMNSVRDAIVQGCAVKVAQVSGEVAGTGLWFTQLAGLFQLAPVLAQTAAPTLADRRCLIANGGKCIISGHHMAID